MNANTREIMNRLREVLDSDQGQGGLTLANLSRLGLTAGITGLAGNMLGGPLGVIIGGAASALLSPTPQSRRKGLAELVDRALTDEQRGLLAGLLQRTLGHNGSLSADTRDQVLRIVVNFLQQNAGSGSGDKRGRCRSCQC